MAIFFFLGIFCYVGTEQGIANWISEFLRTYHGLKPEIEGARAVGLFWGMMTVGCILGLGLLKVMDSKIVLRIFTFALNSVNKSHGFFAGILCTAIAGGAIISLLIGKLKDIIGLQAGMTIL